MKGWQCPCRQVSRLLHLYRQVWTGEGGVDRCGEQSSAHPGRFLLSPSLLAPPPSTVQAAIQEEPLARAPCHSLPPRTLPFPTPRALSHSLLLLRSPLPHPQNPHLLGQRCKGKMFGPCPPPLPSPIPCSPCLSRAVSLLTTLAHTCWGSDPRGRSLVPEVPLSWRSTPAPWAVPVRASALRSLLGAWAGTTRRWGLSPRGGRRTDARGGRPCAGSTT